MPVRFLLDPHARCERPRSMNILFQPRRHSGSGTPGRHGSRIESGMGKNIPKSGVRLYFHTGKGTEPARPAPALLALTGGIWLFAVLGGSLYAEEKDSIFSRAAFIIRAVSIRTR